MSDQSVTQMPAKGQFRKLAECKNLKEAFETRELRDLIRQANKGLDPDVMLRTWIQAAGKQPLIYEADMRQALGMFQSLAYLGLAPNTQLQHAHLIPFRTMRFNKATRKRDIPAVDLQIVIGYPGYIELAYRSGSIKSIHADVVYDARQEDFHYSQGTDKHLHHGEKPPDYEPGGPIQYAYCWVKLASDDQFEVMTWREIRTVRDNSQAYRMALSAKTEAEQKSWRVPAAWTEAPWVKHEAEMAKKSAARRLFKWIPKDPQIQAASAIEDAMEAGKKLDFGPVIEGTVSPMDGIPEVQEEEPPRDPGSTFGIRQDAQQQPETQPTQPPAFEAVVLTEFGELADDGRPITNPVAFARAISERRAKLSLELAEQLDEHNAEAIADAMTYPGAAAILAPGAEPEAAQDGSAAATAPQTPEAVQPLSDRGGRVSWTGYVRAFREASATLQPGGTAPWLEAQRATLEACPLAQRIQCIQAINDLGSSMPAWVDQLIRAPAKKPAPDAKPLDQDGLWVNSIERKLGDILARAEDVATAQAALTELSQDKEVQETMARLKAQRVVLFELARSLFIRTQATITAKRKEGGDDVTR